MKTKEISSRRIAISLIVIVPLLLSAVGSLADLPPALHLAIAPPGISNEFSATPQLDWNSLSAASYVVQSTTNLTDPAGWRSVDLVRSAGGAMRWMAPESLGSTRYYRLVTQPAIFDVQPAFINSSDTNAMLYLYGQLLPSNAIVAINGHNFGMSHDSTGNGGDVWRVSLNGLPPGEPVTGMLTVMDANSNVVATLPVQSPIYYGAAAISEQLQGPAAEPPASPSGVSEKGLPAGEVQDCSPAATEARTAGGILIKPPPHSPNSPFEIASQPDWIEQTLGGQLPAALMKAKEKANRTKCGNNLRYAGNGEGKETDADCGGGTVDLASGEFRSEATDLMIPGQGLDFAWTRTYRSRTGPTTAQGMGWDFSYNVSLTQNADGTVTLNPGNGRSDTFYPAGTNGWFRDEYFCQIIDLDGDGTPDVLFADSSRWVMNSAPPGSRATLARVIDRFGNTMALNYDAQGRLAQIVDDLGRTNSVTYNKAGQIAGVTDFTGRTVRYEYDSAGNLISVISPPVSNTPTGDDFPNGITNRYIYTSGNTDDRLNHNLSACVDGKSQVWMQISYQPTNDPTSIDFDRVDSVQTYSAGSVVCSTSHLRCYSQTPSPTNGFAVTKAVCHDGVGNVTECFYDACGRRVRELDYAGRCDPSLPVTETSNRPTGKLRADDPDYFETKWTWNADSLCTSETLPDGEVTECVYQRAFNQNSSRSNHGQTLGPIDDALHNGDVRVVRRLAAPGGGGDLDGDGLPDITELDWHFEHDPRFGSAMPEAGAKIRPRGWYGMVYGTHRGMAPATGGWDPFTLANDTLEAKPRGWDGTIKGLAEATVGASEDRSRGWDGTIKGLVSVSGRYRSRGWDGTVKGVTDLGAQDRSRGWDGTVKGVKFAETVDNRTGSSPTFTPDIPGDYSYVKWSRDSLKGSTKTRGDYNQAHRFSVELDFVTSGSNPRGDGITAAYNAQGAPIVVAHMGRLLNDNDSPVSRFGYNSHGQLTAITNPADANGYCRVDQISYYSSGPQAGWPQSIAIDESGVRLTSSFEYDAVGNLTRYIDPRTNDWLFSYNALDQCVRVQTPINLTARSTAIFGYDANGNRYSDIIEYRDGEDGVTHTRPSTRYYDALDRCIAVADQALPGTLITNRYVYDADDHLVCRLSPLAVSGVDPNATVTYQYDERGRLFRVISAPAATGSETNQYDYDVNGRMKLGTANNGLEGSQRLAMSYDGLGRLAAVTDPMGNVESYTYDRNGNCTLLRCYGETNDVAGSAGNVLLAQTQFAYDALDRCIQSVATDFNPLTQAAIGKGTSVTAFTYAPDGDCTSVTDDNGHMASYSYDTACRLVGAVSPRRKDMLQWIRDAAGNVTSEVISNQPDGGGAAQIFALAYTYDSRNRCVAVADNVGNTNRYVYDSFNRCVQAADPNGVQSWFTYDDLGRCTLAIGDLDRDGLPDLAVDSSRSYTFDDNSRCLTATDGNTNTTYYAYDSAGHCTSVTQADGSMLKLIWSPRSNLLSTEDATGSTVTNSYDLCDRVVHRDIAARNPLLTTTTFENFAYDGLGRCVSAANDACVSTFAYDSLGHCISASQDGLMTTYIYDGVGNKLSITYPSGRIATYTYNEVDDLTSVSSSASGGLPPTTLATYSYAGPGRMSAIARANGVNTVMQWDGQLNPRNATGDYGWMQLRGISHGASGLTPIDQRRSDFDHDQNRVTRTVIAPVLASGLDTNLFQYDAGNRLLQFANANSSRVHLVDWSLDKLGNRLVETNDSTMAVYTMQSTLPPGDFQMNRYSTTPLDANNYDNNGNLWASGTAMTPTFYAYDYANRLVQVSTLTSGGMSVVAQYAYDALGRCVRRTTVSSSTGTPQTTEIVKGEVCDDGNDTLEERVLGSTGNRVYLYGGRPDYVVFNAGVPQYAHCDDVGNLLAVTDGSGAVLERYAYDAFGAPTFLAADGSSKTGSDGLAVKVSDFGMSRLFRSMNWEDSIGLYYSGGDELPKESLAFFFDPIAGRSLGRVCTCPNGTHSVYDPFAGNPWNPPGNVYKTKPASSDGGKKEYVGHVSLLK